MNAPVESILVGGDNSDLIASVAQLYLRDGAVVIDCTFGKGVFWRKVDRFKLKFTLHAIDLHGQSPAQQELFFNNAVTGCDFRNLPHPDCSADVVVLDPPYLHNPGYHICDKNYRNSETTNGFTHADIIQLYRDGMREAYRVLKPGGQMWVKCKDEVSGGIQYWSHIEIHQAAVELGLYARDLFIIVPSMRMNPNRWSRQIHARKVHSYLWIFERGMNGRKSNGAAP